MSLAEISYRLSVDPAFFEEVRQEPEPALRRAGIALLPQELSALKNYLLRIGSGTPKVGGPGDDLPLINPWFPT